MRPFLVFFLHINISAKPPIQGYPLHAVPLSRRKTAITTQIEIIHFINHYGLNHCALLTLCLPAHTSLKEAQRAYNNAARRFLKELFPAWIVVVEFDRYDHPHFHAVVATRQDFRSAVNFEAYHRMCDITNRAHAENRALTPVEKIERGLHARNVTSDTALKALWKHLRRKLPEFGFSKRRPAELMPIEKNGEAIAVYLTKQFLQEILLGFIPTGARLLRVSTGHPRLIPRISDLVIDTPGRRKYLERRERICTLLGLNDAGMKSCYGRRWAYRCGQVSMALDDHYGRDPIPWQSSAVLALIEEILTHGYVRPDDVDPYDYLLFSRVDP